MAVELGAGYVSLSVRFAEGMRAATAELTKDAKDAGAKAGKAAGAELGKRVREGVAKSKPVKVPTDLTVDEAKIEAARKRYEERMARRRPKISPDIETDDAKIEAARRRYEEKMARRRPQVPVDVIVEPAKRQADELTEHLKTKAREVKDEQVRQVEEAARKQRQAAEQVANEYREQLAKAGGDAAGTLAKNLGERLAPALKAIPGIGPALAEVISKHGFDLGKTLFDNIREGFRGKDPEQIVSGLKATFGSVEGFVAGVKPIAADITKNLGALAETKLGDWAGDLIDKVPGLDGAKDVLGNITGIGGEIMTTYGAVTGVWQAVTGATGLWTAAQWLLNAALNANPIGLIVIAIAALVAGFIIAYKKSETFRKIVDAAWAGIKTAIGKAWQFIKGVFDKLKPAIATVIGIVKKFWPVFALAAGPIGIAIGVIKLLINNWDKVKAVFNTVWNVIKSVWDGIKTAFQTGWDIIKGIFELWKSQWDIVAAAAQWFWNDVIVPVWEGIKGAFQAAWDFIADIFEKIKGAFSATGDFIKGVASAIADAVKSAFSGVVDIIKEPLRLVGRAIQNIPDKIGPVSIPFVGNLKNWGATLASLAAGGAVRTPAGLLRGPGTGRSDSILGLAAGGIPAVRVSTGEGVVTAAAMARGGDRIVAALNAGWIPRGFQRGGAIRQPSGPVAAAISYAQNASGRVYDYGGTGAGGRGWDCSGIASSLYGILTGQSPTTRYFTTESNFEALGFKSGFAAGQFNIGVMRGGGGPNSHMAVTLPNGVAVESGGAHGTTAYGGPAKGADTFPLKWFLPITGGDMGGAGAGGGRGGGGRGGGGGGGGGRRGGGGGGYGGGLGGGGGGGAAPGLSATQTDIAREIVAEGERRGVDPDVIKSAIATGLVESNLTNLMEAVDYDSLGVFQQRPSQGWQNATNVTAAAADYYSAAQQFAGMAPGEIAARVQRPAEQYRGRYQERMGEASTIFEHLSGSAGDLSGQLDDLSTGFEDMGTTTEQAGEQETSGAEQLFSMMGELADIAGAGVKETLLPEGFSDPTEWPLMKSIGAFMSFMGGKVGGPGGGILSAFGAGIGGSPSGAVSALASIMPSGYGNLEPGGPGLAPEDFTALGTGVGGSLAAGFVDAAEGFVPDMQAPQNVDNSIHIGENGTVGQDPAAVRDQADRQAQVRDRGINGTQRTAF